MQQKRTKVRLVFDIGKTNKKCFLFDRAYRQVYKTYRKFAEIVDEDGDPADDLAAIEHWVLSTLEKLLIHPEYEIATVNFSTYGASLVHLDGQGQVLTPLYNYTKPLPEGTLDSFYEKYGAVQEIAYRTGSPPAGMLNAGFQLYWLKTQQPELFARVRWSLHLPQYLSYLLTGIPLSDYTSIGCHTGLWDYEQEDYHAWVYAEQLDRVLAPLVSATTSIHTFFGDKRLKIGTGIHDSSSALVPYLRADRAPFLLVSTGTWSICLNPFAETVLPSDSVATENLNYMRVDGRPVRATRLFLGQEYQEQVEALEDYYRVEPGTGRTVLFDEAIFVRLLRQNENYFRLKHLSRKDNPPSCHLERFATFTEAYHQLLRELVTLQIRAMEDAIGTTPIRKIYIDGGFADNAIFVHLLAQHFRDWKIRKTQSPLGSALGAAMVISDERVGKQFLKKNYALQKYRL